jgi:hypothetical protein
MNFAKSFARLRERCFCAVCQRLSSSSVICVINAPVGFPDHHGTGHIELRMHLVLMLPQLARVSSALVRQAISVLKVSVHGASGLLQAHAVVHMHEQGNETIVQPPLALAINMVSLGASYIRWLAEIDALSPSP